MRKNMTLGHRYLARGSCKARPDAGSVLRTAYASLGRSQLERTRWMSFTAHPGSQSACSIPYCGTFARCYSATPSVRPTRLVRPAVSHARRSLENSTTVHHDSIIAISLRIQQLRSTHSVSEVLDIILPDLRRLVRDPTPRVINALLSRGAYTVAELDCISEALAIQPDAIAWSTVLHNATRRADGIQPALVVYDEACRRGVRVQTSAACQLIGRLVNPRKFYQPDHSSIRRATAIFLRQISSEDKDDDSYVEVSPLLRALTGSTAVTERDDHIRRILDWMKLRKLPIERGLSHLDPIVDACLRCRSYLSAVSAISAHTNLSPSDLLALLGKITRMRFPGEAFMPMSAFSAFLHHWETCGHIVDRSLILTYLKGLRHALQSLGLPWETRAFETSGRTLADARRELRDHIYAFEAYILDGYPEVVADHVDVYHALLYAAAALRVRDPNLFYHLWGAIRNRIRPLSSYSVGAALEIAWTRSQVAQIWADYLASGASPPVQAWTAYAYAMLYLSQHREAFAVIREHIGDDPAHANGAIALFARAPSPNHLARYVAALPRTWTDPSVQRELAKYREHRSRIGCP